MDEIGIGRAEVGFPIVSKQEFRAVKAIVDQGLGMKNVCPARCRKEDIDAVADSGAEEIAVFIGTSPQLMKYSLRMTGSQVLERIAWSVEYARERGLFVHAVSEDSTRSNQRFLLRFLKQAISNGAKGVVICDTLGISTPAKMRRLGGIVRGSIRASCYSVHCHDDLGLATANTLAAVEAGCNAPQTRRCGIGERSGNGAFEEVCMNLEVVSGIRTGIKTGKIWHLAGLVEKYSGVPIPVHKPIIGTSSFAHEAGVHVAAVLRNPVAYEPYSPSRVGRTRSFTFGKHTGSSLLRRDLKRTGLFQSRMKMRNLASQLKLLKESKSKKRMRELIEVKRRLDRERSGMSIRDIRRLLVSL